MKIFVYIGLGGIVGAEARYIVSQIMPEPSGFPTSILIINIIGAFLLGTFYFYCKKRFKMSEEVSLMIGTGVIGSFTTFSTFSLEAVELFVYSGIVAAAFYVSLTLLGVLGAFFATFKFFADGGGE